MKRTAKTLNWYYIKRDDQIQILRTRNALYGDFTLICIEEF